MDNSFINIRNDQLLLINILNTMYNDNLQQINNLYNSNNEIRNHIISILNNYNRGRNNTINTNTSNSNRFRHNNRENNRNLQSSRNNSNSNSNNISTPLVFDFIIPTNRTTNDSFSRIFQRFFEPVEVFPTPSQIEAATRIVRYSDIISPSSRSCPISLETFNDSDMVSVIRYCGHIFNTEQLNTWFRSNCRCPVCRFDIRNYNGNSINNTNVNNIYTNITENTPPNNDSNNNTENIQQDGITNETTQGLINNNINHNNIVNRNNSLNNIYSSLLTSLGSEDLLNIILDPSGNINFDLASNLPTNSILNNVLNNYQRRN